jgi:hypothetical protein
VNFTRSSRITFWISDDEPWHLGRIPYRFCQTTSKD